MQSNEHGLFEAGVYYRGKAVAVEDDGLLPSLQRGDQPHLVVQLSCQRATCITVDEENNIQECEMRHDAGGLYFQRMIPLPSAYEDNHMRVVSFSPAGRLTIDEVAIVGQGRRYFLTQQRVHDGQCYAAWRRTLYVPKYCAPTSARPWPEFVAFLQSKLNPRTLTYLPKASTYREDTPKQRTLGFHQAEVQWFNLAHRLGSARTGAGDNALILAVDVPQNGSRLRFLTPGQIVRFERLAKLEANERLVCLKGLRIE